MNLLTVLRRKLRPEPPAPPPDLPLGDTAALWDFGRFWAAVSVASSRSESGRMALALAPQGFRIFAYDCLPLNDYAEPPVDGVVELHDWLAPAGFAGQARHVLLPIRPVLAWMDADLWGPEGMCVEIRVAGGTESSQIRMWRTKGGPLFEAECRSQPITGAYAQGTGAPKGRLREWVEAYRAEHPSEEK